MSTVEANVLYQPIDDIEPHPDNPKAHDLDTIAASIRRFGHVEPVVVDQRTGLNLSGHGRVEALRQLRDGADWMQPPDGIRVDGEGRWLVPVYVGWRSRSDDEARAALIALNRSGERGGWHEDSLLDLLDRLAEVDDGLVGVGWADDEIAELRQRLADLDEDGGSPAGPTLAERFGWPPSSVLNARDGRWQERKRAWLALGIRSELGRDDTDSYARGLTFDAVSATDPSFYAKKRAAERRLGRDLDYREFADRYYTPPPGQGSLSTSGTSVFDPVVCELVYRWFLPPDRSGVVLDPFAGGSVRGVVAGYLGHRYVGVDLSAAQIAANEQQGDALLADDRPTPRWIEGDATDLDGLDGPPDHADLVFSCPPYYDLEVYSRDPRDLSRAASWETFTAAHRTAIAQATARLPDGAFAVWVVSDVRETAGAYRGLVAHTVEAFAEAGCPLYNEAILVTPMGSLPVRLARQFANSRKLGRTHQHVLVFVKGDATLAASGWGEPTGVADLDEDGAVADEPEAGDPLADRDDVTVHEP